MNQIKSGFYRGSLLIGTIAALPVTRALADDIDTTTSSSVSGAAATGIFATFGIFLLIFAAVGLAFFIWWLIMLIDAFKRTNWHDDSQKTTWLAVLIVGFVLGFGWLATILYFFMIYKPLGKAGVQVAAAAASNAQNAPTATLPANSNPSANDKTPKQ